MKWFFKICTVVHHLPSVRLRTLHPHTALPCFHFQGCLDKEMKMLLFFRQGALLHAGEVTAGVVKGEDSNGELQLVLCVLELFH